MNRAITIPARAAALGLAVAACSSPGNSPPAQVTVTHTRSVTAAPTVTTVGAQAQRDDRDAHGSPAASAVRAGPAQASGPGLSDPVAVVTQFYADISAHDYGAAWALGGDNIAGTSYANWVAGYGTTAAITVTAAEDFGSDQATASISAAQADGSVRNYNGTYTVQNGVIVSAQITQQ